MRDPQPAKEPDCGLTFALMEKHFPERNADNTDMRQMNALLSNLPQVLDMEAARHAQALAVVIARMFGSG